MLSLSGCAGNNKITPSQEKLCSAIGYFANLAMSYRQTETPMSETMSLMKERWGGEVPVLNEILQDIIIKAYNVPLTKSPNIELEFRNFIEKDCYRRFS